MGRKLHALVRGFPSLRIADSIAKNISAVSWSLLTQSLSNYTINSPIIGFDNSALIILTFKPNCPGDA